MEDGVVAALVGVGVEEELGRGVPEGFVELEEDFCVDAHVEGVDAELFPQRECRRECYSVVLEDTEADERS